MRGEGFTPPNQVEYNEINNDQLDRFEAGSVISRETLREAKLLHKPGNPVALLGRGEVKVALTVQVQRITKSAREKIETAGGTVEIVA
jgi:large subunit ribosomal protein L15